MRMLESNRFTTAQSLLRNLGQKKLPRVDSFFNCPVLFLLQKLSLSYSLILYLSLSLSLSHFHTHIHTQKRSLWWEGTKILKRKKGIETIECTRTSFCWDLRKEEQLMLLHCCTKCCCCCWKGDIFYFEVYSIESSLIK